MGKAVSTFLLRKLLLLYCILGLWRNRLFGLFVADFSVSKLAAKDKIDGPSAWDALLLVDRLARGCGAAVFPVSGTLLGLHRQGRLLDHDYDIDVGIFADDPAYGAFFSALAADPSVRIRKRVVLTGLGQMLNPWAVRLPGGVILYKVDVLDPKRPAAPATPVDVFVHLRDEGLVLHGSDRSLWLNRPFELQRTAGSGHGLLIPADVDLYLRENYGDYHTEKRNFEAGLDCPNVANILTFGAADHVNRLYLKARREGGSRLAVAVERRRDFLLALQGFAVREPVRVIADGGTP